MTDEEASRLIFEAVVSLRKVCDRLKTTNGVMVYAGPYVNSQWNTIIELPLDKLSFRVSKVQQWLEESKP